MTNNNLRKQLTTYLNIYLSKKGLQMKPIMYSIRSRITNGQNITLKQWNSIIKFIERERPFRGLNRFQITQHFSPLIINPPLEDPSKGKEIYENSNVTLEPFFETKKSTI